MKCVLKVVVVTIVGVISVQLFAEEKSAYEKSLDTKGAVELHELPAYPQSFPALKETTVKLQKSVLVPMRDGARLSTDIYFPVSRGKPLPVILIRTPYNKNTYRDYKTTNSIPHFFAAQNYIVAVQDVRGRYESEGNFLLSAADRRDGYDTVDWLSGQPWSSGKVGTYGCSYSGENQIQLAAERHPAHRAAIPQAAAGAYRDNYRQFGLFEGGVFDLGFGLPWFWYAGGKGHVSRPGGVSDRELPVLSGTLEHHPSPKKLDVDTASFYLPVMNIIKHYGGATTDYEAFVTHPPADPYWKRHNYVTGADRFNVPALHVNSWFDYGATDTLALFNLMRQNAQSELARNNQFIILSPFGHCASERDASEQSVIGDRAIGDTRFDFYRIYLDWFDHWLKGVDNGIIEMDKVNYFAMGANQWRTAQTWPPADVKAVRFYLGSDGKANRSMTSGVLTRQLPMGAQVADRYHYDPGSPVRSPGGIKGSFDQRDIEQRDDVLVYSTAPLRQAVDIAGNTTLVLYVSSSAKDTDFTAKLVDVYPDGTAFNLQESILRARYRQGLDKEMFMEQDKIYRLSIDLHDISNRFDVGHRIRLEISSSNFPRFVRNLNTGGNNYDETQWIIAENVIYHSGDYTSYLELPVQH